MEKRIPIGKISTPSDIRPVNELRVLELFRSGGAITAQDIQTATGISRPTIMKILQRLVQQGMICSAGIGSSTRAGGKRPELFTFADPRQILSVTFWPESTSLALTGLVGEPRELSVIKHKPGKDPDAEILFLRDSVRAFLQSHSLTAADLYGAAFSVSGTVDYRNMALRYNSQAPEWGSNIPLRQYLEQYLGSVPVRMLENSAKTTGRAVLADDPSLRDKRVLTVFTTWGVAGCLIENGRVLNGGDSLIGEIGHMTIAPEDTERCGCGRTGCLERLVSIERVRAMAEAAGMPAQEAAALTLRELFTRSGDGDTLARGIVRHLAHCFALMLHNMSLAYNPDVIIFQGSFAYADAFFDRCLQEELGTFRYRPSNPPELRYDRSPLELQAAKGCAEMVRSCYFSVE